jgi:hypothetical protein
MSNNYQRLFYILKNMDRDVGYPTGYIKVEINCEVAKLQISLNNLSNRHGLAYQLYGIKKDDKQLIYTVICDIPNENGRADVKISADIHKIGSSKLRLEDINIFAIITQVPSTPSLKCPLVAYMKSEVLWKREFDTLILNKELTTKNDNTAKNDNTPKNATMNYTESDIVYKDTVENSGETIGVDGFEKENETEQLPDILAEIGLFHDMNGEAEISVDMENGETDLLKDNGTLISSDVKDKENVTSKVKNGNKYESEITDNIENGSSEESENNDIHILDSIEIDEAGVSANIQNTQAKEELSQYKENLEHEFDFMDGIPLQNDAELYTDKKFNTVDKFESAITNIYNKNKPTVLGQENVTETSLAFNDILGSVQKNFNDISSIEIDTDNLPSLKDELDKSFEGFNPFKMKSKNFKWWKINSPGYLNNILFRHNIKTYLLFNPKVMLAHYKYRYIIFGIRIDRHSGKEYLICGVPGVYSIDENPFGNIGSWAQIEGYKPKYGAFGYWIILIDPRTGKLLRLK